MVTYQMTVRLSHHQSLSYRNIPVFAGETTCVDIVLDEEQAEPMRIHKAMFQPWTDIKVPSSVFQPITRSVSDSDADRFLYQLCHIASSLINPTWPDQLIRTMIQGLAMWLHHEPSAALRVACTPPTFSFQLIDKIAAQEVHRSIIPSDVWDTKQSSITINIQHLIQLAHSKASSQSLWEAILGSPVELQDIASNQIATGDHYSEYNSPPVLPSLTQKSDSCHWQKEQILRIQNQINKLSSYYPSISQVTVDGIFKDEDNKAVKDVQRLLGIHVDGLLQKPVVRLLEQITQELP